MPGDTRKMAAEMDIRISRMFSKYGLDPGVATRGSGSVQNDGDRRTPEFMREDKYRSSVGWSIGRADWEKSIKQATRQGKKLLFVVENVDHTPIACMPLHQFLMLLSELTEARKEDPE